jgi:hypothetical protein
MAVNISRSISKAIVALVFTIWVTLTFSSVHARPTHKPGSIDSSETGNHLVIRFDTLSVKPGQSDVILNVYYTFTTTKPHNFRGYNAHFFFDSTKVRIVKLITDSTASANLGYQDLNPKSPEAAVVTLGDQEIDLSNPILFKLELNVLPALTDTTSFRWDYIDIPDYFGVDLPVELLDGSLTRKWPKVDVAITTPPATAKADSSVVLPIAISDLSGANIQSAELSFTIDTSIVTVANVTTDTSSHAVITSVNMQGTNVVIDFGLAPKALSFVGSSLARLTLQTKPREDTACTAISDASFVAQNIDAAVETVTIGFGSICVYGKPVPTGLVGEDDAQTIAFESYPNPIRNVLHFRLSGVHESPTDYSVTICDLLGRELYRASGFSGEWIPEARCANGIYHMIVKNVRTGEVASRSILLER